MNADEVLLGKINKAVAAANEADQKAKTAHNEHVSQSKIVGVLLLEAKKRYPKVADFEAFLKRIDGLKLSRAYDYLRLVGGRVTDEELREEARERKRKSRAKKKLPPQSPSLPKPEPPGKTDSFRDTPHVTESPEISAEQRRAENARLDDDEEPERSAEQEQSAYYRDMFVDACSAYLPKLTELDDRFQAIDAWLLAQEDWKARFGGKKAKRAA